MSAMQQLLQQACVRDLKAKLELTNKNAAPYEEPSPFGDDGKWRSRLSLIDAESCKLVKAMAPLTADKCIAIAATKEKGIGVMATADLEPWDVLFVEAPLSYAPQSAAMHVELGSRLLYNTQAQNPGIDAVTYLREKCHFRLKIDKTLASVASSDLITSSLGNEAANLSKSAGVDLKVASDVLSIIQMYALQTPIAPTSDQNGALGLYKTLGLMNHSCNPNTMSLRLTGGSQAVIALRAIRKGHEITHSYAVQSGLDSTRFGCQLQLAGNLNTHMCRCGHKTCLHNGFQLRVTHGEGHWLSAFGDSDDAPPADLGARFYRALMLMLFARRMPGRRAFDDAYAENERRLAYFVATEKRPDMRIRSGAAPGTHDPIVQLLFVWSRGVGLSDQMPYVKPTAAHTYAHVYELLEQLIELPAVQFAMGKDMEVRIHLAALVYKAGVSMKGSNAAYEALTKSKKVLGVPMAMLRFMTFNRS